MPETNERGMRVMRRFVAVPSTWEGWVQRVMTVFLVLAIFGLAVTLGQVNILRGEVEHLSGSVAHLEARLDEQDAFSRESRGQRVGFQEQETARQCAILEALGVDASELADLACSP